MVAHNVYSFYWPETFLDGTLWFQHSATGQSLGLVISRKNSKNPWSHGPATSCDILRQHQQTSPLLHNNKRTQTQQKLTTVVTFISVQNLQHCSNPQDAKTAAWIPVLGIARLHLVLPNNFHWPKNACASSTQLMSCWLFERLCSRWTYDERE